LSASLTKILPKKLFNDKKSKAWYDRYAVKALGVRCLGDSTLIGSKLLFDKNIPKEMVNWLRIPPNKSSFEDYKEWIKTLEKIYGKRKFTTFDYDISQLY